MPTAINDTDEDQQRAIRSELDRLLASDTFKGKDRLHEFLRYVIDETLEGRADLIRGKSIAVDVYGRNAGAGEADNVVRAHARRMRQYLGEYYRTEGADSPVRIHMTSGSYVPSFEFSSDDRHGGSADSSAAFSWDWRQVAVGALAGFLVGIAALVSLGDRTPPSIGPSDELRAAQREAIFSKSPSALQAANLAEQARGLIFPVFDPDRQRLTSQLFLRAIDLDPQYFGGYGGAAQSLASLAMLLPPGEERDLTLEQAELLARQAVEIAPAEAWVQSAVGWTALVTGDYEGALAASRRAYGIDPDEGNVLDFYAGVALFSGEFEEAATASDPARVRLADKQRLAHRNVHGAASFHLGDYDQTLTSFHDAAALGDPLSVASLAYQAAALDALGRQAEGRALVDELKRNWPDANVAAVFEAYYRDPAHAADIIDRLVDLGW